MERIYVSSSICSLPATPDALLFEWEQLCRKAAVDGLCLDTRLDPELQRALLALCRRRQVACPEIGHPAAGSDRRPAASAVSADRDERSAALQQVLATGRRAHEFGVSRMMVPPWLLALSPPVSHLAERFQRGLDPGLADLQQARSVVAEQALDACCLVLDPTLRELEDLGVELVLLQPTAWPHQFPGVGELARLERIFDGAPIASCLAVDWWQVGRHLDGISEPPREARVARVADACGLSAMLPPGTGELDWEAVAPALRSAEAGVLTLDAALSATPRELAAGLALLQRLLATPG